MFTQDELNRLIGQPSDGGFFAGVIALSGEQYGVIVAPKAEGESAPMPWGEGGQEIPNAASLFDGLANTQAMAEAGSELAKWALGLDINGHQDWYIPSRDELELLYRQFKPSGESNLTSFRDGDNPSSIPPGYPYTAQLPQQTSAEEFREGGSEAFATAWYWSSTQYSAYYAWDQWFGNGVQDGIHKDDQARARAVRRFKLSI